ncbi:hypothetical protein CCACVL1_05800 [Corchorus capsularis]|uniref:Uncharacterized protein n=1 Tax=Corchorus capsularis TaxID=210143 RepID=A0A1R3JIZ1_COCAP|nr:hypothetical protein CCACVL1_05800 [Corchorus capsularis]
MNSAETKMLLCDSSTTTGGTVVS